MSGKASKRKTYRTPRTAASQALLNSAHAQEINWSGGVPLTLAEPERRGIPAQFVYMIAEGDDGPFKIGHANNPIKRLRGLQTGNPRPLQIVQVILGSTRLERYLHLWANPDVIPGRVRNRNYAGRVAADTEWFKATARTETSRLFKKIATAQRRLGDDWADMNAMDWKAAEYIGATGRAVHFVEPVRLMGRHGGYVAIGQQSINRSAA